VQQGRAPGKRTAPPQRRAGRGVAVRTAVGQGVGDAHALPGQKGVWGHLGKEVLVEDGLAAGRQGFRVGPVGLNGRVPARVTGWGHQCCGGMPQSAATCGPAVPRHEGGMPAPTPPKPHIRGLQHDEALGGARHDVEVVKGGEHAGVGGEGRGVAVDGVELVYADHEAGVVAG
jgi:hypothetical protein